MPSASDTFNKACEFSDSFQQRLSTCGATKLGIFVCSCCFFSRVTAASWCSPLVVSAHRRSKRTTVASSRDFGSWCSHAYCIYDTMSRMCFCAEKGWDCPVSMMGKVAARTSVRGLCVGCCALKALIKVVNRDGWVFCENCGESRRVFHFFRCFSLLLLGLFFGSSKWK